jgi:hypothetical protein
LVLPVKNDFDLDSLLISLSNDCKA